MEINLSEVLNKNDRTMVNWAYKVHARKGGLEPEEVAISESMNKFVDSLWKTNDSSAINSIAQVVNKIVEQEIFSVPDEILEAILRNNEYGEFDKVKITMSPKNTLIARESAARTGNVDKSYINYEKGTTKETHLQIETQIKMSDLRREGALQVADLAVFAIEAFRNEKFTILLNFVGSLATGSEQAITSAGGKLIKTAMDSLAGYVEDNCFEGTPMVVGLSNQLRNIYDFTGYADFMSSDMKQRLNDVGSLPMYRGASLYSIKAGKKLGDGRTLVDKNKVYGFAGIVGEQYTRGSMRTLMTPDNNGEYIDIKWTGVDFGFTVTDPSKIAVVTVTS